ncbi:MAG TPA: response regulator [Xanthobacteraceae bacterium]|nr:response regulator [Xanthobacteraceae bacterium]
MIQKTTSPPQAGRQEQIVFVIDDDAAIRAALRALFESIGLRVEEFESASEFVARRDIVACLVLDVRLPGKSGLELQAELVRANIRMPIVFISGHADIQMTVKAMKAGAVEFLTKPFREQEILDAVGSALERERKRHAAEKTMGALHARFATLTPRERDVARCIGAGMMNKQAAAQLGISEVTVKIHRMQAMRKLGVRSLVDLVQIVDALGVCLPGTTHGCSRPAASRSLGRAIEDHA